ncbi:MAG: hypothetical protein RLY31_506 [Bacteroidota bacterium]|jgi:tRNA G18 (ribose-2'-O)-methylase SpoU
MIREATSGDNRLEIICEDIQVPENIGMIFRLAEAFAVCRIHLSQGCLPLPNQKTTKASRGAVRLVPHLRFPDTVDLIRSLQKEGYRITALETGPDSRPLRQLDFRAAGRMALLVGGEKYGIRPETLAAADDRACIPLNGRHRSINVANALAIALYEIKSQVSVG